VGDAAGHLAEALQPVVTVALRLEPQPGLLLDGVVAFGAVAHHGDRDPALRGLDPRQRRLGRKLGAVPAARGDRDRAHQAGHRIGQRLPQNPREIRPGLLGEQHLGVLTQQVGPGPAEDLLGTVVDQHDPALVHHQDRVRRRL
jgi:hypothetical protein